LKAKLLSQPGYNFEYQIKHSLLEAGLEINPKLSVKIFHKVNAVRVQYRNWEFYFSARTQDFSLNYWEHFWAIIQRLALTEEVLIECCYLETLIASVGSISLVSKDSATLQFMLTGAEFLKYQEEFALSAELPTTRIRLPIILRGKLDCKKSLLSVNSFQLGEYVSNEWSSKLIKIECDINSEKILSNKFTSMRASIYLGDIELTVEELMQLRIGTKIQLLIADRVTQGFLKLGNQSVAQIKLDLNTTMLEFVVLATPD
jgi:hypothetical protein